MLIHVKHYEQIMFTVFLLASLQCLPFTLLSLYPLLLALKFEVYSCFKLLLRVSGIDTKRNVDVFVLFTAGVD